MKEKQKFFNFHSKPIGPSRCSLNNGRKNKYITSFLLMLLLALGLCSCTVDNNATANIKTYNVISVNSYLSTETNRFGGITNQTIKYRISYIDENNNLKVYDDFENTEYGLEKIIISDETCFVIKECGLDEYRILYITAEEYAKISNQVLE